MNEYRKNNPEVVKERKKKYYDENKEKVLAKNQKWREDHPEELKRIARDYCRKRYYEDLEFKMMCILRSRARDAIKRNTKSASTLDLLGCSVEMLKDHLELQFDDKMTWENYGTYWHVDHIRPCASFDLTDPAQQRECFNWTNLQPLEAIENRRKGAKFDWVIDE